MADTTRHVLGISGGKDSTALAIYMRDRVPNMEYFFCDTGAELKETHEYIDRVEVYLGKKVERLNPERDFDHWLQIFGNYLPSSRMRWCTRKLKIEPFEKFVGTDPVVSYVGIRADEDREGYISTKPNIRPFSPSVRMEFGSTMSTEYLTRAVLESRNTTSGVAGLVATSVSFNARRNGLACVSATRTILNALKPTRSSTPSPENASLGTNVKVWMSWRNLTA